MNKDTEKLRKTWNKFIKSLLDSKSSWEEFTRLSSTADRMELELESGPALTLAVESFGKGFYAEDTDISLFPTFMPRFLNYVKGYSTLEDMIIEEEKEEEIIEEKEISHARSERS